MGERFASVMVMASLAASTAAPAAADDSAPNSAQLLRDEKHAPPVALFLLVGDGWGCAELAGYHVLGWECWSANDANALGNRPRASRILPLDRIEAQVAKSADRICGFDPGDAMFRCWHRPVPGLPLLESPPAPGWRNPTLAQFGDFHP